MPRHFAGHNVKLKPLKTGGCKIELKCESSDEMAGLLELMGVTVLDLFDIDTDDDDKKEEEHKEDDVVEANISNEIETDEAEASIEEPATSKPVNAILTGVELVEMYNDEELEYVAISEEAEEQFLSALERGEAVLYGDIEVYESCESCEFEYDGEIYYVVAKHIEIVQGTEETASISEEHKEEEVVEAEAGVEEPATPSPSKPVKVKIVGLEYVDKIVNIEDSTEDEELTEEKLAQFLSAVDSGEAVLCGGIEVDENEECEYCDFSYEDDFYFVRAKCFEIINVDGDETAGISEEPAIML